MDPGPHGQDVSSIRTKCDEAARSQERVGNVFDGDKNCSLGRGESSADICRDG